MKNQTALDMYKKTDRKNRFTENPFLAAVIILGIALAINSWLESESATKFLSVTGHCFNYILYILNSIILSVFNKLFGLSVPLLPDSVSLTDPWLQMRGFFAGSAIIGLVITLVQKNRIKFKNTLLASVLTGIFLFCYYVFSLFPDNVSVELFIDLLQRTYLEVFAEIIICYTGLLSGTVFGFYLIGNNTDSSSVKFIAEDKWDPN